MPLRPLTSVRAAPRTASAGTSSPTLPDARVAQGNTAGFRAFFERRFADRNTVIMLTNGGDTDRMGINDSIQRILRGESLPRR